MVSLLQEASDPARMVASWLNAVASLGWRRSPCPRDLATLIGVGIAWILSACGLGLTALMILLTVRMPVIRETD